MEEEKKRETTKTRKEREHANQIINQNRTRHLYSAGKSHPMKYGKIPVDSQEDIKAKRKKRDVTLSMRNNPSTHPIKHKITLHSRVNTTNSGINHPGGHAIGSQLIVLHSLV